MPEFLAWLDRLANMKQPWYLPLVIFALGMITGMFIHAWVF